MILTIQLMALQMLCPGVGFATLIMLASKPPTRIRPSTGGLLFGRRSIATSVRARYSGRKSREGMKVTGTCSIHRQSASGHGGEMSAGSNKHYIMFKARDGSVVENWEIRRIEKGKLASALARSEAISTFAPCAGKFWGESNLEASLGVGKGVVQA
jgi:hypothetical protein